MYSRRVFTGAAVALATLAGCLALLSPGNASSASGPAPDAFGSVAGSPQLPADFGKTFKSRFVEANGIRQHVVIGGEGPPLLLVHGWPQNWYAWRLLMPALARKYTVIAPDQRGIGLSEKTPGGYDAATLADDLAALMTKLGHQRFAVVGHDTGYIIGYALAADHRDRVDRLAIAEIPGPPGVGADPSLWLDEPINNKVWHIPFNRVNDDLIVDMVHSNANGFYGYEFAIQAGGATLPSYATDYYIKLYNRNKDVLRASFGLYRAWGAMVAQNRERAKSPLTIPVLGIGGANSWGPYAGDGLKPAANDVQTVVIPGVGHWVAETAPEQMLKTLDSFLAPYRAGS
ncbi:alpha/beta fold hydrolase [Kribbella sp. NPDC050124]|uniref:alpha/beta fold hydrolase n=1 Tax=Kribbella sp. NPDC050124 TaxID=3364114 RepID=UPI00379002C4